MSIFDIFQMYLSIEQFNNLQVPQMPEMPLNQLSNLIGINLFIYDLDMENDYEYTYGAYLTCVSLN